MSYDEIPDEMENFDEEREGCEENRAATSFARAASAPQRPPNEPYDPLRAYYEDGVGAPEPGEEIASAWSRRSFAQALLAAVQKRQEKIAEAYADKLCDGSVSLFKLTVELEREAAEEERKAEERQAPTLSQMLIPLLRRDLIPERRPSAKPPRQKNSGRNRSTSTRRLAARCRAAWCIAAARA